MSSADGSVAARRKSALTQFLSLAGAAEPSALAQRFLVDYDDGEGNPLSLSAAGWRKMLSEDRLNAEDLASLGVTDPRCVARLVRLTRHPSNANLEHWLRLSQCESLLPRFEAQGFLSLECVLESGLLEVVQNRSSSLRRRDLESLGLKMKQWKNVERTLVQLKELGARAVPPLVLTAEMTPAERSDTAERLAALLPQMVQPVQSPSLLNPTPSPSLGALQSPANPPSAGQGGPAGGRTGLAAQSPAGSPSTATPRAAPLIATPEERTKVLPSARCVLCPAPRSPSVLLSLWCSISTSRRQQRAAHSCALDLVSFVTTVSFE